MCESCVASAEIAERVRMNLAQSAKGAWQIDVTVESGSVERSRTMLEQAIASVREVMSDCGLKEAQA